MSNKAGFFGAISSPSKAKQNIDNGDVLIFDINKY